MCELARLAPVMLLLWLVVLLSAPTSAGAFSSTSTLMTTHFRQRHGTTTSNTVLFSASPQETLRATAGVRGPATTISAVANELATTTTATPSTTSATTSVPSLSSSSSSSSTTLSSQVRSVNYFISRACNYSCKFCFHTAKNSHHLTLAQAKLGLDMLRQAGTEKINFAGGEPFLHPQLLGELCRTASHDLGLAVSIISNGSMITDRWMQEYGEFVDVLGVSVDSFRPATNAAIGRGGDANNNHAQRILHVRELCARHDVTFKMNTVVCSLNWEEDMREQVQKLDPKRWKVFQVLMLEGENAGLPGDLRDARPLVVSDDQFWSFVDRHAEFDQLIPEPNNVMQNSYLLLDEDLRFLDCSQGGKVPSESILKVGVEKALQQSGFDHTMFEERGGVFDWKRDRSKTSKQMLAR